jgi:hypothetical protein
MALRNRPGTFAKYAEDKDDKKTKAPMSPDSPRKAVSANQLAAARKDLAKRRPTIGKLLAARDQGKSLFGQGAPQAQAPAPQAPTPEASDFQLPNVGSYPEDAAPNWAGPWPSEAKPQAPAAAAAPSSPPAGAVAKAIQAEQAPAAPAPEPSADGIREMATNAISQAGQGAQALGGGLADMLPQGPAEGQDWSDYLIAARKGLLGGLSQAGNFLGDIPRALAYDARQLMGYSPEEAERFQRQFLSKMRQDPEARAALPPRQRAKAEAVTPIVDPNAPGSGSNANVQALMDRLRGMEYHGFQDPSSPAYLAPSFNERFQGTAGNLEARLKHFLSPWGAPAPERSHYVPGTDVRLPLGYTVPGQKQKGVLEGMLEEGQRDASSFWDNLTHPVRTARELAAMANRNLNPMYVSPEQKLRQRSIPVGSPQRQIVTD